MGATERGSAGAGLDGASPPKQYGGICSTCNLAPTCMTLQRNPDLVVWECEEFDTHEAPRVRDIVERHVGRRGGLMATLEEIQSMFGYLPRHALRAVAEATRTSLVDVYGVATFYKAFSLRPRGKHLVSVCLGTACHVRGGPSVAREVEHQLRVRPGETTPDREFTLETVNCLGACALGPVVVVDGHYFPQVGTRKVSAIIDRARAGLDRTAAAADRRIFPIQVRCPRCNHSLMDLAAYIDGYPSIRVTVSFNGEHGWLRLSSLYGSYEVEAEHAAPRESIVNFFCPHCHTELRSGTGCPECGAPMVPMAVEGGGVVRICSRQGCRGHILDLGGDVV